MLLVCALFSFQKAQAQHCNPGFQFALNGNTVVFEDQSTADGSITAYNWDFGDGNTSTEQNPTHAYAAPGTYNVCLTITAHNPNCTATFCLHLVITHPPIGECHAEFIAQQTDLALSTVHFSDQSDSDGIIGTWVWDFGDGGTSTEQNPTHTYPGPGVYLVCLTITDEDGGCSSHICHQIVVHHPPMSNCHAAFTMHFDAHGLTVQFTNTSTGTTNHTTYLWDFGDGTSSTEQNPHHTYPHNGHYTVCLFMEDLTTGCASHLCYSISLPHMLRPYDPFEAQDRANEIQNAVITQLYSAPLMLFPNPVVDNLLVNYQISIASRVKFEVYNLAGIKVLDLAEITYPAGAFTKSIAFGNLLPGEYVLKMTLNGTQTLCSKVVKKT